VIYTDRHREFGWCRGNLWTRQFAIGDLDIFFVVFVGHLRRQDNGLPAKIWETLGELIGSDNARGGNPWKVVAYDENVAHPVHCKARSLMFDVRSEETG
jgi:hypothetical protein